MPRSPKRLLALGMLSAAVFVTGCDDNEDEASSSAAQTEGTETGQMESESEGSAGEGTNDPFIPGRECDESLGVTWESFGQGFILSHCAGCHSSNLVEGMRADAPLGIDFETHELSQSWLDRIYARAADDNTTMPPVDALSPAERSLLGDWLACGAP